MAEAAEKAPNTAEKHDTHGHNNAAHGHAHAEHKEDPMAHIRDVVWYGVDKTTGKIVSPYDSHGHRLEAYASYEPAKVGPFKLEFTKHMFNLTVGAAIFFVLSMIMAKRILAGIKNNHAPKGKIANALEGILEWVKNDVVIPAGGHHAAHYTPLFINYFMLILICNYLGMIPNFGSAMGNFGITSALAVSVYALIWIMGLKHNGLGYIVHLVPPGTPLWLWPLMFVLELVGPIIKCFVLAVRLFANMIAGHLVISQLLALGKIAAALMVLGVPLALGLTMMELLVGFLQAYVFTLLAVIFIGGAIHPEH